MLKKKSLIFIVVVVALFGLLSQSANAYHETLNVDYPRIPVPGGSFDLNKFLEREHVLKDQGEESRLTLGIIIIFIFVFLLWLSGFILFGALIYVGISYLTSGANPGMRAKAVDHLTNILWGIGILLFAYIIVFIISPDIVKLKLTGLDSVHEGEKFVPSEEDTSYTPTHNPDTAASNSTTCAWDETLKTCYRIDNCDDGYKPSDSVNCSSLTSDGALQCVSSYQDVPCVEGESIDTGPGTARCSVNVTGRTLNWVVEESGCTDNYKAPDEWRQECEDGSLETGSETECVCIEGLSC